MTRRVQNRAARRAGAGARMAMMHSRLPGATADQPTTQSATGADWEVRLPADARAVPAARHAALRACRQAGASEEDCFALDLALGEALANAVTHGAPQGAVGAICLRLWRYGGRLIIEVSDHGPGFDPPPPPYAMPADMGATHGRGLPLMERLTDALLISRGDARTGGASTYLVKTLHDG